MVAAKRGHTKVIKLLIANGANPSLKNEKGVRADDLTPESTAGNKCFKILSKKLERMRLHGDIDSGESTYHYHVSKLTLLMKAQPKWTIEGQLSKLLQEREATYLPQKLKSINDYHRLRTMCCCYYKNAAILRIKA